MYASYLDIHHKNDIGVKSKTKFHVKRDDFAFQIVTFPFISSNTPASPAF